MTTMSLFEEKTRPQDRVGLRRMISDDLNILEKNIEKTFLENLRKEVQKRCQKNQKATYTISTKNRFTSEPLLLGAVPIKSELLREVQCWYEVPEVFYVILNQWRTVMEAIRDADHLVILGYSFPKEDTYGGFFFREGALARRKKLTIEYYALRKKSSLVDLIHEAFSGTLHIKYKGKVDPAPKS